MSDQRLSIVIAGWRPKTLRRALASITAQGRAADGVEVVVVGNPAHRAIRETFDRTADGNARWRFVECDREGGFGYYKKQFGLESATGTHVAFLDDDDIYLRGALAAIRTAIEEQPERVHLFKIDRFGRACWTEPTLRLSNVSSQGAVVPNIPGKLGSMVEPLLYHSDYEFIAQTIALHVSEPVWHEKIIVISNSPAVPWRRRRSTPISRAGDRLRARAQIRTRLKHVTARLH